MIYKGHEIAAEVKTYEKWSLDDGGEVLDSLCPLDGFEVIGYLWEDDSSQYNADTIEEAKASIAALAGGAK